jgi:hypothetical protein
MEQRGQEFICCKHVNIDTSKKVITHAPAVAAEWVVWVAVAVGAVAVDEAEGAHQVVNVTNRSQLPTQHKVTISNMVYITRMSHAAAR